MPQPTLAAFKFTKKVTVGDGSKNVDVNLPKTVPEKENIKPRLALNVINNL